jgi:hypothetical protein
MSRMGRLVPPSLRPLARKPVVRYRFLGLRPADAVLASYPKSGSTWVRFLLTHVLAAREADFDYIRETMPRVGRHRRAPAVLPDGGRFLRTHEPLQPFYGPAGQPVIYLVRDGRDVCISYFNHVCRQGYSGELAEFADAFLNGRVDGYGTWHEHVLAGLAYGGVAKGPFLLVKYEALRADAIGELQRMLDVLGVQADRDALAAAVAANEREQMQAKEADSKLLAARSSGTQYGTAESRSWSEAASSMLQARFERVCGPALRAAGYDPSTPPAPPAGG